MIRPSLSTARFALVALVALALGCSRSENEAAKERLSRPAPESPVAAKSQEVLVVGELAGDRELQSRISRMSFAETAARLGSLQLATTGELTFTRDDISVRSKESVKIVQAKEGDFSVFVQTGNGSEQQLVFVNGVLFLKNNNGRWRASRDPVGERSALREDSAGIWRSFYDLFSHVLILKPAGETSVAGRSGVRYTLRVEDKSDEARALGRAEPPAPLLEGVDAGVADDEVDEGEERPVVDEKGMQKWVSERVLNWREKARPAGGEGELVVDRETGALLRVRFDGRLAVGDQKKPAKLHVKIAHEVTGVGKDHEIAVPKDAIDEVVRKKWPVKPRELLEKEGLVAPLPKEEDGAEPSEVSPP